MIRRVPHFAAVALSSLVIATSGFAQASVTPVPMNVDSLAPAPTTDSVDSVDPGSVAPAPAAGLEYREVFGVSRALRVAMLANDQAVAAPLLAAVGAGKGRPRWIPAYGTVRRGLLGEPVFRGEVLAPTTAGMWWLEPGEASYVASSRSLTFITTVPFSEKQRGHLNGYHIGTYPTEGAGRTDAYAPPTAFIEVTPENQDVFISQHFRLRQFLTKDQFDVWPKYVALNLRLIDKLELVIQELNLMGSRALAVHVMSGFRTPQYNGPGGDGRAALSRHMYGDAADIWVDGDDDGLIDDLNGDGRNDIHDAELLVRAVERVEQKYPELTGGAGLYEANHAHGPFVHVDVRGSRVRW